MQHEDSINQHKTHILLDSLDPTTGAFLQSELESPHCQITVFDSCTPFEEVIRNEQPHVVIFDHIHTRRATVQSRIGLLKQLCPDARVIAISGQPTEEDGDVVEQGVFYYLTHAPGPELIRVINVAARGFLEQGPVSQSTRVQPHDPSSPPSTDAGETNTRNI